MLTRLFSSALVMVFLGGCGNLNSVYRKHDFNDGALIDIKQRAIVSGYADNRRIVCSEPSPDALSSYAGELAANIDSGTRTAAQIAAASQEAAAYVGLRSQTIQVLRDQFYRLCEARMNGMIDDGEYQMLLTRSQRYTVAILAVEQLTGALQAPSVALTHNASSTVVGRVDDLERQLQVATEEQKKLKEQTTKDPADEKSKKALAEKDKEIAALKQQLSDGKELIAKAASTGQLGALIPRSGLADAAAVVKSITEMAFDTSDSAYLCFNRLTKISGTAPKDPIAQAANKVMVDYCKAVLFTVDEKGTVVPIGIKNKKPASR